MPRTKGSKNKPKVANDYASQIAEKQEFIASLNTEITTITANTDALKADLRGKKASLKEAEKELASLEAKKRKRMPSPPKKQRKLKRRLC